MDPGGDYHGRQAYPDLLDELARWGSTVPPPEPVLPTEPETVLKWSRWGGESRQARWLTEGMRQVLLAVASYFLDRRDHPYDRFVTHLQGACEAYHRAWNTTPPPPIAPFQSVVEPDAVPRLVLEHLASEWGGDNASVGMVRSALARFFPGLNLLGSLAWEVRLPVLLERGVGEVKTLVLERFDHPGVGRCFFADPVSLGCTALDPDFRDAVATAWQWAAGQFHGGCHVRWRIDSR